MRTQHLDKQPVSAKREICKQRQTAADLLVSQAVFAAESIPSTEVLAASPSGSFRGGNAFCHFAVSFHLTLIKFR
jgi:hypothetical protein